MIRPLLLAAAFTAAVACTASSTGGSAGSDLSNTSKGSPGPTGPRGPTGATGATGPAGTGESLLPQSGSRLRALREVSTGDDGSQQQAWVTSFWDSKLNMTCWVGPASDGQQRCLPVNGASLNQAYFADGACTSQVAVSGDSWADAGVPEVDAFAFLGFWGASQRFFRLGASYGGPLYQWNGAGGIDAGTAACVASPEFNHNAWFVGAEMAPSEFVRFTVKKSQQ